MARSVVVLGAGYAGAAALLRLSALSPDDVSLTIVADMPHHLVRHEVHRVVRRPNVDDHLTVPIDAFADPDTTIVQGEVTDVDVADRRVDLADGDAIDYDALLVALGSETAFYGIDGLAEYGHTLKTLEDAHRIHDAVAEAAERATADDPARVVVGGGGLSGIQTAGEVAAYRDDVGANVEISVVEALSSILPNGDERLQSALRTQLRREGIEVLTGDPIVEATPGEVRFDARDPRPYDVLVWTGGVKGRSLVGECGLEAEHDRLVVDTDFQTDDDRVFAVGDTALVQTADGQAPPTAQAAMGAGEVAAENVVRELRGRPLREWSETDLGTLVSVGETAFAANLLGYDTEVVDGLTARTLKKGVAARWLARLTSWPRALRAWSAL
ncbi:MAG: NAD(P)/FAD-dependent oxidoreductase [Halanaeroarchaeum sp.]